MRVSQWQPSGSVWDQLQQLQSEMNRLFDRWGGDARRPGYTAAYPAVNVWEEGDALNVEAELPGMDLKDLEIYVTGGNQLTIKGKREMKLPEKATWHRQERGHGTFARTLALPIEVDPDKVDARFDSGVLMIRLPKHEASKPRKINVKAE